MVFNFRNTLILILFFAFYLSYGQGNANLFHYTAYKVENSSDTKSVGKFDDFIAKHEEPIQFELKSNEKEALFYPIEKLNNSQTLSFSFNKAFVKTQGEFYYDYDSRIVENRKPYGNKNYIVTYPFDYYTWEIDSTTV
ncbi:MAG: hypothetical protein Q4G27_05870 [Flavobacteriaceae bacterium]|nr:hypothetical protein [Flavobacteriaceae bacterium]